MGLQCVDGQIVERREQPKILRFDTTDQSGTASAHGAVADPDMIQIGVDFESDAATVARALVRSLHILAPSRRVQTDARVGSVPSDVVTRRRSRGYTSSNGNLSARERTEAEYRSLLQAAGLERAIPTRTPFFMNEGRAEQDGGPAGGQEGAPVTR
jgi:hypothetical protein